MFTKITITFMLLFALFADIKQYSQVKNSRLSIKKFDINKKNNIKPMQYLSYLKQEKRDDIKHCRAVADLVTQKIYCSYTENLFITFNR